MKGIGDKSVIIGNLTNSVSIKEKENCESGFPLAVVSVRQLAIGYRKSQDINLQ